MINAVSLEGYLEKQSPGVVKIYQKRYFAIRNNGEFLVWFGKKPNSIDVEPKGNPSLHSGIIVIIRIEELKPADFEDRVLTINYNSRWFILRAVLAAPRRKTKKAGIDGCVPSRPSSTTSRRPSRIS